MCARVLVIDDDPVNADLLGYLLRAFGHEPILALSGEAALERTREQVPDLVLCDIQMPSMDGFELLRLLRDDRRFSRTPVIGVTALAMLGDRERILAAGFDGYLTKPIAPETFVIEVEKYLPPQSMKRPERPMQTGGVAQATAPPIRGGAGYALVVDDISANVDLLRHLITSLGVAVRSATSAEDALRIAGETKPDLIISDIHMPGQDGIDFLAAAKTDPVLKDVPFLLVSASVPSVEDRRRADAIGVDGMLIRPLDPEVVLQVLSTWIGKARTA